MREPGLLRRISLARRRQVLPLSRFADAGKLGAVAAKPANNLHRVKHFWLCERCTHVFTIAYQEESGVVLKLLWPELPVFVAQKELRATFQN
jgi:hypothetical protein